jgi:putative N-acetylmannosamine-6-phosphate epimerase
VNISRAVQRERVDVPIFGLYKFDIDGYTVRITPTLDHAEADSLKLARM